MTSNEILSGLKALSSEKYKANVVKLGIPEACSIGVSTGDVRKLAKTVGKDNALAHDLWNTGYHEARLLAVLIVDKKQFSLQEAEAFMHDVISWDQLEKREISLWTLACNKKARQFYMRNAFNETDEKRTIYRGGSFSQIKYSRTIYPQADEEKNGKGKWKVYE